LDVTWMTTITLEFGPDGAPFRPNPAPARATGRRAAWYRGDMHLHTVHSDGRRQPAELPTPTTADTMVALTNPIFLGN
jgi:hypothetical protein